ncbi:MULTISPECIES: cytochrome P450 family protein [Streptomyces]|uniref:cytochrome P450 family protein n=1 Tax=Streptomyces TaxID=1883 RepID=UPI00160053BB|nr:cytochrome P450 [Streptomyces murinus]MBA9050691.1 cytochrome P450 [Streptomyces murinus]
MTTDAHTAVPSLDSDLFHIDQYETYAALREREPVSKVSFIGREAFLITRHAEAKAALGDLRLSNDFKKQPPGVELPTYHGIPEDVRPYFANNMGSNDPPTHTRLRRLVSREFTARRVESMRTRVAQLAEHLLDGLAGERETDLVERFAYPLPITVISELLGVEERYQGDFGRWSNEFLVIDADRVEQREHAARALVGFILELVDRRRADPGSDLLSALIHVHDEDEDRLSTDELASVVLILLIAGFETSVSLIAMATYLLLTHPGELAKVRADPSLVPNAVDEVLRFLGPAEITTRGTLEPVEIGGVHIPAHSTVLIAGAAANRDPRRFPDPERFDVTRDTGGHLSFGHGIHFCVGGPLARLEGEIALRALLNRFPGLDLAIPAEQVRWRRSFLRGIESLPVRLGR